MKGNWSRMPLWIAAAAMAVLLALMLSQTSENATGTQQEQRIAKVLSSMEGAGRVEVILYYTQSSANAFAAAEGAPSGAIVVAEGADDIAVRLNLIRAVRTLLGLPESAVDVFAMEANEI